jgi:hypothetical protein
MTKEFAVAIMALIVATRSGRERSSSTRKPRFYGAFCVWNRKYRLSDYGMFSLKAGLICDSGSHWSPYSDLYT